MDRTSGRMPDMSPIPGATGARPWSRAAAGDGGAPSVRPQATPELPWPGSLESVNRPPPGRQPAPRRRRSAVAPNRAPWRRKTADGCRSLRTTIPGSSATLRMKSGPRSRSTPNRPNPASTLTNTGEVPFPAAPETARAASKLSKGNQILTQDLPHCIGRRVAEKQDGNRQAGLAHGLGVGERTVARAWAPRLESSRDTSTEP